MSAVAIQNIPDKSERNERGASAVQVGTANYLNPLAAVEIAEGIEAYAAAHGLARIADLVGSLEWPEGR